MRITEVKLRELTGTIQHPEGPFWEERLIRPVDVYPEFQAQPGGTANWQPVEADESFSVIKLTFIEIHTDEGVTGLGGPVSRDVATLLHIGFRDFLHRATGGVEPGEGRRADHDLRMLGKDRLVALEAARVAGEVIALERELRDRRRVPLGNADFA